MQFSLSGPDNGTVEIVQSRLSGSDMPAEVRLSDRSGLYTDMNAIRRDDITDAIHSIYVTSGIGKDNTSRESKYRDTEECR